MTKSLVIYPNGEVEKTYLNGYDPLSEAVGGWIECVPSDDRVTIWCNEEGKLNGLQYNPYATAQWSEFDKFGCIAAGDTLVGIIVIQGPVDAEGNCTDCPDWLFHEYALAGEQ